MGMGNNSRSSHYVTFSEKTLCNNFICLEQGSANKKTQLANTDDPTLATPALDSKRTHNSHSQLSLLRGIEHGNKLFHDQEDPEDLFFLQCTSRNELERFLVE